jgi:hypothetical protein
MTAIAYPSKVVMSRYPKEGSFLFPAEPIKTFNLISQLRYVLVRTKPIRGTVEFFFLYTQPTAPYLQN